jgi:hypothetical protein
MTNNYQEPEAFEIGRAQDIVLGAKVFSLPDNIQGAQPSDGGDIDESDE